MWGYFALIIKVTQEWLVCTLSTYESQPESQRADSSKPYTLIVLWTKEPLYHSLSFLLTWLPGIHSNIFLCQLNLLPQILCFFCFFFFKKLIQSTLRLLHLPRSWRPHMHKLPRNEATLNWQQTLVKWTIVCVYIAPAKGQSQGLQSRCYCPRK